MVALFQCFGSLFLFLAGAEGARVSRKRTGFQGAKFIGGVPVFEYHAADARAAFGELESQAEQEWILILVPGTTDAQVESLCKVSKNGCNLVGHPTGGVPFLELRGTEVDLEQVIHHDKAAVKFVTPDQDDMLIPELEEDAGVQSATWGLNRIGADARGRTGAGVTIYVQDTGVRVTHQEFGSRASSALDLTSGSPVECNGDLNCARDAQGHGTHCAGSAAGATFGVASSALVRSVKTLSDQGSGARSWQYTAIDWVTLNGARPAVISMSLGGNGADPGYLAVIDAAVESGVTVVVAGGNSNSDACNFSPAFAPSAITVGSSTSTDARSSFSNYGSCTNIWAPGSSIVSAAHTSDSGSRSLSGTSMACPHVSGGAALVLSANPTMKSSAVLQQLLDDAYLNVLSDLKFGDTNALLCVAEGGAPPTPTPQPTPAPPPGTWVITGSGCEADGDCVQSSNYPSNYGNNQVCQIQLYGDISIAVDSFATERNYDKLVVGGTSYSGSPPSNLANLDGTYTGSISWSSDFSVTAAGWRLCKN